MACNAAAVNNADDDACSRFAGGPFAVPDVKPGPDDHCGAGDSPAIGLFAEQEQPGRGRPYKIGIGIRSDNRRRCKAQGPDQGVFGDQSRKSRCRSNTQCEGSKGVQWNGTTGVMIRVQNSTL